MKITTIYEMLRDEIVNEIHVTNTWDSLYEGDVTVIDGLHYRVETTRLIMNIPARETTMWIRLQLQFGV